MIGENLLVKIFLTSLVRASPLSPAFLFFEEGVKVGAATFIPGAPFIPAVAATAA